MKTLAAGYVLAKLKIRNGRKPGFSAQRIKDAAKELGSMGGAVGGPARAEALPSKELNRIARYAAYVRWNPIDPMPFSDFV